VRRSPSRDRSGRLSSASRARPSPFGRDPTGICVVLLSSPLFDHLVGNRLLSWINGLGCLMRPGPYNGAGSASTDPAPGVAHVLQVRHRSKPSPATRVRPRRRAVLRSVKGPRDPDPRASGAPWVIARVAPPDPGRSDPDRHVKINRSRGWRRP